MLLLTLISLLILIHPFAHAYYHPPPLYGQTSIYVNSRIYFCGGTIRNIDGSVSFHNKIIYLDLLKTFNTLGTIPWYETSISPTYSNHILASACKGGQLSEKVFIYG